MRIHTKLTLLALGLLCFLIISARGAEKKEADPKNGLQAVLAGWDSVRLESQKLEIRLENDRAVVKGRFVLEAKKNAPQTVFAFPVRVPENEKPKVSMKFLEGEAPLALIPYVLPVPPRKDKYHSRGNRRNSKQSKKAEQEEKKRRFGERLRFVLDKHLGYRSYGKGTNRWYACRLELEAGERKTILVEATTSTYALAATKEGPSRAVRIPLRLGNLFAQPPGKIWAKLTLSKKPSKDDVLLVRPKGAVVEENKMTVEQGGKVPIEDFLVAWKDPGAKAANNKR